MPGYVASLPRAPSAWTVLISSVSVVVVTALGRLETNGAKELPPIALVAGMGVLWLLAQRAGWFGLDMALLVGLVTATNLFYGMDPAFALAAAFGIFVQVGATVTALRWVAPEGWALGGTHPLEGLSLLNRVFGAVVVGGVAGGLAALPVLALGVSMTDTALLTTRAIAGGLAVVPAGLIVGWTLFAWLDRSPFPRTPRPQAYAAWVRAEWRSRPAEDGSGAELLLFNLIAIALYLGVLFPASSLQFLLLLPTAWVALRFSPTITAGHCLFAMIAVTNVTLAGHGPFATPANPHVGDLLAQTFIVVVVLLGLTLAVGRVERRRMVGEIQNAHQAADRQATLVRAIIDRMQELVVVVDTDRNVLLSNPAATRVFGDLDNFSPLDERGRVVPIEERTAARALREGEIRERGRIRRSDGTEAYVEVAAIPLAPAPPGSKGTKALRRVLIVARDVTAEEVQRRELSAFAGVVAHDLQNPIAAIEGWQQMLEQELAGADGAQVQREAVRRIGRATERMSSLVSALLRHATSRDARIALEAVPLAEVVRDVVDARDLGASVHVAALPDVCGDAVLLRQLFDNLIDNAVKYVPPERAAAVTIDAELVDSRARIRITDNGVGIPAEARHLVFQHLYRVERADSQGPVDPAVEAEEVGGNGVGLAICRRIVDRHHGSISVEDNPDGPGTRIVVELGLVRTEA